MNILFIVSSELILFTYGLNWLPKIRLGLKRDLVMMSINIVYYIFTENYLLQNEIILYFKKRNIFEIDFQKSDCYQYPKFLKMLRFF